MNSSHLHRSIFCLAVALVAAVSGEIPSLQAAPVRVLIWDEQQPAQKQAYTNFLGNQIAVHLRAQPGFSVSTARLDDPQQGLAPAVLDACDVLVWWGHVRNGAVTADTGKEIVRRIKSGQLSFIALHSAHWATPFVEAMNERAREDVLKPLSAAERARAVVIETNLFQNFRTPPKYTERLSPSAIYRRPPQGPVEVKLTLPNCCFPAYRGDGKPSVMRVLLPDHPIAKGVPAEFSIAQTEMYDEPFHVPTPDAVVLEEHWERGEWFRSGSLWNVGKGKVFYFRPGHETYPVYKDPNVLRVIENAVRWLGEKK